MALSDRSRLKAQTLLATKPSPPNNESGFVPALVFSEYSIQATFFTCFSFHFAQRALCASAILLRAATESFRGPCLPFP